MKSDKYKIVLSWIDKKTYGLCDFEKKVITINLPLFLAETFIHEFIHAENDNLSENTVLKLEKVITEKLTVPILKSLSRGILLHQGKRCVKISKEFIKKGRLK